MGPARQTAEARDRFPSICIPTDMLYGAPRQEFRSSEFPESQPKFAFLQELRRIKQRLTFPPPDTIGRIFRIQLATVQLTDSFDRTMRGGVLDARNINCDKRQTDSTRFPMTCNPAAFILSVTSARLTPARPQ